MIRYILMFVIWLLASIGIVAIIYIIDEIKKERKKKREEKFKQDVLKVLKEEQNA